MIEQTKLNQAFYARFGKPSRAFFPKAQAKTEPSRAELQLGPNPSSSQQNTQGFLTQDLFHSTSLATQGSSGASKEAKFFKELIFLGFMHYFLAKIEQSSKLSKTELKNAHLEWFFEVYSILAEKQRMKQRIVNALKNFTSINAPLDPQVARLVEIYLVLHFVLKFCQQQRPLHFFHDFQSNL